MAGAKHGTLSAAVVTTVTITGIWDHVDIVNLGSDPIYVRAGPTAADITDPTVQGDDCEVVAAGGYFSFDYDGSTYSYKLISAGGPDYSVVGEQDG